MHGSPRVKERNNGGLLRAGLAWILSNPFTTLLVSTAFLGVCIDASGLQESYKYEEGIFVLWFLIWLRPMWGFITSTTPSAMLLLYDLEVPMWLRFIEAPLWGLLIGAMADRVLRSLIMTVVVGWGKDLADSEKKVSMPKRGFRWLLMHPMTIWSMLSPLLLLALKLTDMGLGDGQLVSMLVLTQGVWLFMHFLNPIMFLPTPEWLFFVSVPIWGLLFGLTADRGLRWLVSWATAVERADG